MSGIYLVNNYSTDIYWQKSALAIFVYFISILIVANFNLNIFSAKEYFGKKINFKLLLFVIIGSMALYLFNYLVVTVAKIYLFNSFNISNSNKNVDIISIFSIVILFPFFEEIYFRKYIAEILNKVKGFKFALLMSTFIFTLPHIYSENGLLGAFVGGLTLGFIYLKTSNFWFCFICHSFYNTLIFVISKYLDNIIFENYSIIIILSILMVLMYGIFINELNKRCEKFK